MRTSIYPVVSLALSFLCLMVLNHGVFANLEKDIEKSYYIPPPNQIEHMTFGYEESVADSLWLRYIQGLDVCHKYAGLSESLQNQGVFKGETRTASADQMDDFIDSVRNKNCDGSWAFLMLDAITRLAPRFYMPYSAGAVALSVLVEDYKGAQVIFDRALEQFPNDWSLNYRAAYHYLFDLNNPERAAQLLERAAENGAPEWTKALAAKIYSRAGQAELALRLLNDYLKVVKNEKRRKQIKARLEAAKKMLSATAKQ